MKNRGFANAGFFASVLALGLVFCACAGNKIGKLDDNATVTAAVLKMDEILNFPGSSDENKTDIQKLKQILADNGSIPDYWTYHGKLYIDAINNMIPVKQPGWETIRENVDSIIPMLTVVSIFVAALGIWINLRYNQAREKKNDEEKKKDDCDKMYQQLELASIELFKWEADKSDKLVAIRKLFKEQWTDEDTIDGTDIRDVRKRIVSLIHEDGEILLETWCTQGLNLFELVIEFTLDGKFPPDIFETWLPWIFEFTKQKGFKQMWQSRLYLHYSSNCRKFIGEAIKNDDKKEFIAEIKKIDERLESIDLDEWTGHTA